MDLNEKAKKLLESLEQRIRNTSLTHAKRIDNHTFICYTRSTGETKHYVQCLFEELDSGGKELMRDRTTGEVFKAKEFEFKIVAIFDSWLEFEHIEK